MTYRNRHECKYVVPDTIARRVVQLVRPHVAPDGHAAGAGDPAYTITSLYLDDDRGSLYRETVEGRCERFKLRVRGYGADPRAPVFLEVKRRHDRVVQKLRCPLARELLADVLDGRRVDTAAAHTRELAEFQRLMLLRRARPCVQVRYRREAWVAHDDAEVRVTVDRELAALRSDGPAVAADDPRFVRVPTRGVVLELKFTDRCPPWMAAAMRAAELQRVSFSKYCNAVDALGRDGDDRAPGRGAQTRRHDTPAT